MTETDDLKVRCCKKYFPSDLTRTFWHQPPLALLFESLSLLREPLDLHRSSGVQKQRILKVYVDERISRFLLCIRARSGALVHFIMGWLLNTRLFRDVLSDLPLKRGDTDTLTGVHVGPLGRLASNLFTARPIRCGDCEDRIRCVHSLTACEARRVDRYMKCPARSFVANHTTTVQLFIRYSAPTFPWRGSGPALRTARRERDLTGV